jgi:hypothetical protein
MNRRLDALSEEAFNIVERWLSKACMEMKRGRNIRALS